MELIYGGSHIAIGVIDDNGKIVEKMEKRMTSVEKQDSKKAIVETILVEVEQFKNKYEIKEIGIGMPGFADKDGTIIESGNIGIKNFNLVEALNPTKLPIRIQNDAKCAALAEHAYGCLKGYDRSVFLTLGTGIGGAAFWKGHLLGADKRPGYEFGHMVIEKNGIPCHCGRNGCFERYASMKVLKNNLRRALHLDETTRGEELLQMIRSNHPQNNNYEIIEKVVADYVENLSVGIQNLIEIFEPEMIGIGGSFVYFEEVLLERLKRSLKKSDRWGQETIKVEPAVLGNDAGIIGAVL